MPSAGSTASPLGGAYFAIQGKDVNFTSTLKHAESQAKSFGSALDGAAHKVKALDTILVGTAVAAVSALSAKMIFAVTTAGQFERQMAMVSTVLMKDTMHLMPKYTEAIKNMAVQFGDSTASLSKALYDILSAQFEPSKALGMLAVSAKAGVAGITDTATAARSLITIMNAYGYSASKAADISDWLWAVVYKGVITFPELANQIGQAAAGAGLAGVSLEELGAAIAVVTRAGVSGGRAMTSINGLIRNMIQPTDQARKLFKQLYKEELSGLVTRKGLTYVIDKLRSASIEEQAGTVRNVRGFRALAAMLQDLEGYHRDLLFMKQRQGMTDEAYAKMQDTLMFKLSQLKQSVLSLAKTIGQYLLPATKWIVDGIKSISEWFRNLHPNIHKAIADFAMLAPAMTAVYFVLPMLTKAAIGLGAALMLSVLHPLTLIKNVIAGGVLLAAFGKLANMFATGGGGDPFAAITKGIENAWKYITKFVAWFKNEFAGNMQRIMIDLSMAWDYLMTRMGEALGWASSKLAGLTGSARNMGNVLKAVATGVVAAVEWIANKINAFVYHLPNIIKMVGAYAERIALTIKAFFEGFGANIKQLWNIIGPGLADFGVRVVKTFLSAGVMAGQALIAGIKAGMAIPAAAWLAKVTVLQQEKIERQSRVNKQYGGQFVGSAKLKEQQVDPFRWAEYNKAWNQVQEMNRQAEEALEESKIDEAMKQMGTMGSALKSGLKQMGEIWGSPLNWGKGGFKLEGSVETMERIKKLTGDIAKIEADMAANEKKRNAERLFRLQKLKVQLFIEGAKGTVAGLGRMVSDAATKGWDALLEAMGMDRPKAISRPVPMRGAGRGSSGMGVMRPDIWFGGTGVRGHGGGRGPQDVMKDQLEEHKKANQKHNKSNTHLSSIADDIHNIAVNGVAAVYA